MEIDALIKELSTIKTIDAIALGGSRASGRQDDKSDYDLYIYSKTSLREFEKERKEILEKYCNELEIGNSYWEYEDNCILKNGTGLDIIMRTYEHFDRYKNWVLINGNAFNGYTTCLWDNILKCKILFDREGNFAKYKEEVNFPYPQKLKENIIKKNMALLTGTLPSYDKQLKKCFLRGDIVSINHRTTEFLASYFDILFALNETPHPGEKRLLDICKNELKILPNDFEKDLRSLFDNMFKENPYPYILKLVTEIKKITE